MSIGRAFAGVLPFLRSLNGSALYDLGQSCQAIGSPLPLWRKSFPTIIAYFGLTFQIVNSNIIFPANKKHMYGTK